MNPSASAGAAGTLLVSRPKHGRLGSLLFDGRGGVTLTTEGSGPAVDELTHAWAEVSALAKVPWVKSVVKETPRGKVTAIRATEHGRDDENYFYAVLDTLSRRYGFRVDIAR